MTDGVKMEGVGLREGWWPVSVSYSHFMLALAHRFSGRTFW